MASETSVNIRFRMHDGTDIGPNFYETTLTVQNLKERILAEWPKELLEQKKEPPKLIQDMKLILSGQVLENAKLLSELKFPTGLPDTIVTMHLVVRPPTVLKPQGDNKEKEVEKLSRCNCTIV